MFQFVPDWRLGVAAAAVAIFFILIAIYRSRRERALNARRQREFAASARWDRAEQEAAADTARDKLSRDYDVIEIIHDLSAYNLGPAGLPLMISHDEAFEVVRLIRASRRNVMIVIHTAGGYSMPADMIAEALAKHPGRKLVVVPYAAMSGGTVIALAADEIALGASAMLGPVGTQYGGWPLEAYEFLAREKGAQHVRDENLLTLFVARQFESDAAEKVQKRINKAHLQTDPALAAKLISAERAHGDGISVAEARQLGLALARDFPKEAYALVDARLRLVAMDRQAVARRQLALDAG
jgi:ClpP class serine protease